MKALEQVVPFFGERTLGEKEIGGILKRVREKEFPETLYVLVAVDIVSALVTNKMCSKMKCR